MSAPRPPECRTGDEALARGAWAEAREAFEEALRLQEIPEALEGLGNAAWWLDLADTVFNARERAYRLYLDRDDRLAAARIAVWLAWDYGAFRGENMVANGWLRRARSLLEHQPACVERAWLELRESSLGLLDPERALAQAEEGTRIAREAGSIDFEMLGRTVQGAALVAQGAVAVGMRLLEEVHAAVIGSELKDPIAIGLSWCYMIWACERVRDYERAIQWCTRLKAFCAKWGLHPLRAVCRMQYASICVWRGTWLEAEQELCAATDELATSRPAMTGDALVRLAELRRRQGRLDEAAAMFDQTPSHGSALLGRAELAFDRGDWRAAVEQAARYLRHIPVQDRADRAAALELQVRAFTRLGECERAKTALEDLSGIARLIATLPLRGAASFAAGCVALAERMADAARKHFEDAVDLYLQSGAPFETARARIELARTLESLGRTETAINEARQAIELFSQLKAESEVAKAQKVLESIRTPREREEPAHGLTRRELEVLRLVAEGLSNQMIAERLFVSDHTIHRHLSNILDKLNVSTRAAAVAQAARKGLLT